MRRLLLLLFLPVLPTLGAGEIDYNRDIRPLLSQNCFACHGPDAHERKADLHLDTFEGATADHDGVRAMVPGKPDDSEMIHRIFSDDPDEIMPPPEMDKTLTPEQKDLLKRWIASGGEYAEAWAYVPPKASKAPTVKNRDWPANWIDHHVLDRLEREGLKPAPDADRATLVRRLHFDLTGLPPDLEDIETFTTVEARVDRLLASPAFGERMAILWLDLVRYADTVGYHGDQDHNISPYRDYVIDAFNRNLPFDQFTREQLGGDLLPDAGIDQKIASGYNRLLQTSHEGGVQPKEYLAIYGADRVRNVSAVWMGATVGCAQCHDHKYDPYTAKDFYAMQAFFADVDEAQHFKVGSNSLPTKRPPEIKVLNRVDRERLATLERELAAAAEAEQADLKAGIAALKKRERTTMITVAIKPRDTRVLPRGNWLDDSGELVEPAIPSFMGTVSAGAGSTNRATRLDFANWLTDADQAGGLTARVFANRFWALFFGSGLSRSLDDFGGQGQPPRVHAALLDQLALEYLESGWDTKALIKTMVTSRAYRQSSVVDRAAFAADPHNELLARQSRYRLPAEMIRDNALAVSGLLVDELGGPSAKPYQPAGYYKHLNFPTRKYKHHADERQWRRGVYVHWQRQFLHPMLKAFDAPTREECSAERPRSNTPTAAMVLLNDPTFVEAARAFGARIVELEGDDAAKVRAAFVMATSREPSTKEAAILADLLASNRTSYRADPAAAKALLETGQAASPAEDLNASELASWTAVARALLNLNETIFRN